MTFKGALHANVFDVKVPAKQLADKIGKSYTYLANAANENQEESHFQARDIIPLTLGSGSFSLLDYIEAQVGRMAFVVPRIDGDISQVAQHVASLTADFSDLLMELARSMDEMSDKKSGFDRAENLFRAAFDGIREPRSYEYKQGVQSSLIFRCAGVSTCCPYPRGTAQADAWYAGIDEGHAIWRKSERETPQ